MTSHDWTREPTGTSLPTVRPSTMRTPLGVAIVVAVLSVLALLIVDHGPWNRPHLRAAEINYRTTRAATEAVGATVSPTEPKSPLEPDAAGPKPAQPVNQVPE